MSYFGSVHSNILHFLKFQIREVNLKTVQNNILGLYLRNQESLNLWHKIRLNCIHDNMKRNLKTHFLALVMYTN